MCGFGAKILENIAKKLDLSYDYNISRTKNQKLQPQIIPFGPYFIGIICISDQALYITMFLQA